MAHVCHATNCTRRVSPKMLMCAPHWFKLPKAIRQKVWATYVPGQEIRKDPTPEYLAVQREAVQYIELLEARKAR